MTLITAKDRNSRVGADVRRPAKVQYRLPSHATTVATATESTFALSGWSRRSPPGPKRSRLNRPTSTTNAAAPTEPNRSSSSQRDRMVA